MDPAQQQRLQQLAVQHALLEQMGDSKGRTQGQLWQALSRQCERAARGDQDDGPSYLTMPF